MASTQFPPSNITVDVEEMDDSPLNEEYTTTGFSATRRFKVPAGSRTLFAEEMLGGASTGPQRYPGKSDVTVIRVALSPFTNRVVEGTPSPLYVNVYEDWVATVEYGDPSQSGFGGESGGTVDPDTLLEESLEPSAEYLTFSANNLRWAGPEGTEQNGAKIGPNEAPGKLVINTDWVLTKNKVTSLSNSLWNLLGRVNEAQVTSLTLGYVFPPETLLYASVETSRQIFVTEPAAWRVTLRFSIKPTGWNKLFNPINGSGGGLERIRDDAGLVNMYELEDFTELTF